MTINWNGYDPAGCRRPVSFKSMGKWERSATPKGFAQFLIDQVKPHAVLWVSIPTVYTQFRGLELYDIERNAHTYEGPGPIIAHPPCGPWGRLKGQCFWEDESHGIKAMQLVHRFGGVIEQPLGSSLFYRYGDSYRGTIRRVNQFDYGHRTTKPTLLYYHPGRESR